MTQPVKSLRRTPLLLLTLLLACCSIVYELLLAQSLAVTLGNTFLRYNVTIGLYLASLGLGALLCSRTKPGDRLLRLIDVELALALLGALSPVLVLCWNMAACRAAAALGLPLTGLFYGLAVNAFDHSLIVVIGLLSGFELPLLMQLSGDRANQVLAVDYAGTFVGALLFPLVLLPYLGVLTAAVLIGAVNALCGLYLLFTEQCRPSALRLGAYGGALALMAALFSCREALHQVLSAGLINCRP
ncbi:MAG: hypothetical protein ABIJ96_17525 [Elusimicrobiota bacterium]